jgi:hypothetical protein
MFEQSEDSEGEEPEEQKPTNYTGVIIGVIALPVYFLFLHFGNPEMGLAAFVCFGAVLLAIGMCWDLRRRVWFWGVIVFVLALHVPLILMVKWPHMTISRISLLPIGLADLLITVGAVRFVEKFIVKAAPLDEEE